MIKKKKNPRLGIYVLKPTMVAQEHDGNEGLFDSKIAGIEEDSKILSSGHWEAR